MSCASRQGVFLDVAAGNPIQQGPLSRIAAPNVIPASGLGGNGGIVALLTCATTKLESAMRHRLPVSALIALSLIGAATAPASAQNTGAGAAIGNAPGVGTNPPVGAPQNPAAAGISPAPGGSSTTTTGMGTGSTFRPNPSLNQPGVPNTSTPGQFGTGASPSGLPGDDPAHPGFPARVGQ
jgi:hypothetical protein